MFFWGYGKSSGSKKSLLQAKADGGDLRILYSPLEAVQIAEKS